MHCRIDAAIKSNDRTMFHEHITKEPPSDEDVIQTFWKLCADSNAEGVKLLIEAGKSQLILNAKVQVVIHY